MVAMKVRPVDPRDTAIEVEPISYRVYFWTRSAEHLTTSQEEAGYISQEYDISDADVCAVLNWADANTTKDSSYSLYVLVRTNDELNLVHLAGADPTAVC